jgi:hypothetical protein
VTPQKKCIFAPRILGNKMNNPLVTLDQNAVANEIERQIALRNSAGHSLAHDHKLIGAIESVTDNATKAALLRKCLDAVSAHQTEVDAAFRAEVDSRIKIVEHEIAKDKSRTELFNNRALILFAWVFPIAAGFAAIKYLESYVFAVFIIIVLYGVLIALYFSQANGLSETWKVFAKDRRKL